MAIAEPDTFLYVIGYEAGPCKVGYSYHPEQRLRAMRRGGHVEAVLLDHSTPINSRVAYAAERYAHWLLREHHLEHEWFNVPRETAVAAVRKAVEPESMRHHDYRDPIPNVVRSPRNIAKGENIETRFPVGTKDRIVALLDGKEGTAAFIRETVEAELKRREGGAGRPGLTR